MFTRLRKIVVWLCLLGGVALAGWLSYFPPLPKLQTGDLLFQTSRSNQTAAIIWASGSLYTHVGIVEMKGAEPVVIHAGAKVEEMPLEQWVNSGYFRRLTVMRFKEMDEAERKAFVEKAREFTGRPYDIFFRPGREAIYCSELPYQAMRAMGKQLGEMQKIGDLHFDNPIVRALIEDRLPRHPDCRVDALPPEKCLEFILAQKLVTPVSVARDAQLEKIYDNYPF